MPIVTSPGIDEGLCSWSSPPIVIVAFPCQWSPPKTSVATGSDPREAGRATPVPLVASGDQGHHHGVPMVALRKHPRCDPVDSCEHRSGSSSGLRLCQWSPSKKFHCDLVWPVPAIGTGGANGRPRRNSRCDAAPASALGVDLMCQWSPPEKPRCDQPRPRPRRSDAAVPMVISDIAWRRGVAPTDVPMVASGETPLRLPP